MALKKGKKMSVGAPVGSTINIEIKILPPVRKIGGNKTSDYCNKDVSSFGAKTV